ncbi:MAG: protease modulator HflC [Succinivibrionaceae bacterium]|nr:protease modulator HflC [Ruminobacter sp.]MDY5779186.1 protease modulator HflC [Succinivibrionaceae bacterium]MEE1340662.1 protease modulator HflC [Succinivibrionaceae bacterium]
MKGFNIYGLLVLVVALVIALSSSLFIIKEGEVGLVLFFNKIQRDSENNAVYTPGIHFKWPIFEKVIKLDQRIQTFTSKTEPFITKEKKELYIDYYVQWRIDDVETYYMKTRAGDKFIAENNIRKYIDNSLRAQIGNLTIQEIVTGQSASDEANANYEDASSKREQVMQQALTSTEKQTKELGVSIVDVRMKKINLPETVSNSIYLRMRTERKAVAQLHRSLGKQKAEEIKAKADRDAKVIISEAEKKGKEIRSEGDAESTRIYAKSYSQNAALYDFLRSMEAYRNSLQNGGNVIVTGEDSEFFKYFK